MSHDDDKCIDAVDHTPAKRSKRPSGLLVQTDSLSLGDYAAQEVLEDMPQEHAGSTPHAWSWVGATEQLLATPKNCLDSARRKLYTAPCKVDGVQKVWMRLELRIGLETLVNGVGNGRLGWLLHAVRIEFSRSLDIEPSRVDVRDIYETPGSSLKTCVEVVVSPMKGHISNIDLDKAACDLMDQAERNRASVDCAADLFKLISHVEIKDHGSARLQSWSLANLLVVLVVLAAHYHVALAFRSTLSTSLLTLPRSHTPVTPPPVCRVASFAHTARPLNLVVLENKDSNYNRLTLMIDLDKTAMYGNDGNDLGMALQWMDKDQSQVKELYTKLVNPNLRQMYDHYVQQGKELDVVIYTRRPQLLHYKSCFRRNTISVRYTSDWHRNGQVYFPSSTKSSEDIFATYCGPELLEDEQNDVKKSLDRLLAARDAIMHNLGLSTPPPVVVTAQAKDVGTTARYFGVPEDSCLLFDDNVELRNDPYVVIVDPLESLPADRGADLVAFMQQVLPVEELDEDLIMFLEEASPQEVSIKRSADGILSWWVHEAKGTISGWRTPQPKSMPLRGSSSLDMLPLSTSDKSLEFDKFDKHIIHKTEPFCKVSPAGKLFRAANDPLDLRSMSVCDDDSTSECDAKPLRPPLRGDSLEMKIPKCCV
jgi:hypothetical protein